MSNMPIMSNNTSAPGKAGSQANQSTNANESVAADVQPFGDVLARQISDKVSVETKAVDILSTDAPLLIASESVKTENVVDTTNTSLPADMLATLLPVAVVVAQMASAAPNSAVVGNFAPEQLKGATDKGASTLPASSPTLAESTSSSPLDMTEIALKGITPPATPKVDANALTLRTDVLTFAKEVELRTKLDATMTMPSTQLATPQAALVQAVVNVSPIAAPATQLMIDMPVTQRQWGNEFSQKITWMATQQDQHAELHLNPAQLGPLDVVIKVSGDQATAQFTSAHAAVRDVIEQSIPKLREMLADNGIMLGNTTVSDQAPREQRGEFGNQRQTAPNGRVLESAPSNMSETRAVTPLSRHNGMVDTFA